jgi:hypothetical protein
MLFVSTKLRPNSNPALLMLGKTGMDVGVNGNVIGEQGDESYGATQSFGRMVGHAMY